MGVRFLSNVTKEYPDMIQIIIYKEPVAVPLTAGSIKRNKKLVEENYVPDITSLKRTKTLIKDIIFSNDFDLFCTFTFSPDKVDRFNYSACYHKISAWLHHQSDNSRLLNKRFEYLLVPEKHKSGAWHFHALIKGYTGSLHDSGHKTITNYPIYNITSFRSGFTTAVEIYDRQSVGNYVSKYITKDFITQFNQRRFFCSRGLVRPKKETNSPLFRSIPPLFRRRVSESENSITYLVDNSPSLLGCGSSYSKNADQWSIFHT